LKRLQTETIGGEGGRKELADFLMPTASANEKAEVCRPSLRVSLATL